MKMEEGEEGEGEEGEEGGGREKEKEWKERMTRGRGKVEELEGRIGL